MKKIVGMFPGNSSQKRGMYRELYEGSEVFRKYYDQASEYLNINLYELADQISDDDLNDIEINTSLIVAGGYASYKFFCEEYRMIPICLIGHSLGEYTAIAASGMVSLEDALMIVNERAKLAKKLKNQLETGMCVVSGMNAADVEEIVLAVKKKGGKISCSCYNTPTQICISGKMKDIESLTLTFRQRGAFSRVIVGNAPFHSVYMAPIKDDLKNVLDRVTLKKPQVPVFSNWYCERYSEENAKEILIKHLLQPIYWYKLVGYCETKNPHYFIEFGSNGVLTRMNKKINQYINGVDFSNGVAATNSFMRRLDGLSQEQ